MTEREGKVIIQLTFERDEARDQRDALRKERDEARVWWLKGYYRDWQSEAARRGWDCFNDQRST